MSEQNLDNVSNLNHADLSNSGPGTGSGSGAQLGAGSGSGSSSGAGSNMLKHIESLEKMPERLESELRNEKGQE